MKLPLAAFLAVAVAAAAVYVADAQPGGTTYYVAPAGSDAASGRAGHPWRTLARVARATLHAGDTVLLRGGARYAGELEPPASGVTFASYGGGRATIAGGIWFASKDHLTFRDLAVTGAPREAGLTSSARGTGSTHVTIDGCAFTGVRIGINSANPDDGDWRVTNTLVRHTGDSGVIVVGHDMTFDHDRILDTGEDASIPYARHGIYAKGPSLTFEDDVVRHFSTDGISLRFRDARVTGSAISGGAIGIAFFEQDPRHGRTVIEGNTIGDVRDAGIYVSPDDAAGRTRESFLIERNRVGRIDAHTAGKLTLQQNS